MSKELLKTLKESIDNAAETTPVKAEEKAANAPVEPVKSLLPKGKQKLASAKVAPLKGKDHTKKGIEEQQLPQMTSLEELYQLLKEEKQDFTFGRRVVYVDDEIGGALDFLRKKAKINANVLTSYLLKQFFLAHKELIQELKSKRENKFLD